MPRGPLPGFWRYLFQGNVQHCLSRHYSTFNAHTASCASPLTSPLFRITYKESLCRSLPTPAGQRTFPTLSPQSLCRRLVPYPAVFLRCSYPFLPQERRLHVTGNTFSTRNLSLQCYFHREAYFGAADIRSSSGSHTCLASRLHPPQPSFYWAARPYTPRIAHMVTHSGMWHRYVPDMGNWHGWTFTRWIAALSAAPSRTSLFNSCFTVPQGIACSKTEHTISDAAMETIP